jgi:hypothetical protein
MVLEATILCIDNSEYVRNSDYLPTRLQVRDEYSSEQKAFPPDRRSPRFFIFEPNEYLESCSRFRRA